MKNCLYFCNHTLPTFILRLGIWSIIDAFRHFNIVTDVLTLDASLLSTTNVEEMKFAATRNDQGLWTNRSTEFIVYHLTKLISSPGTVEEAMKINTALKCLSTKKFGNSSQFYELISEGCHRRMMFQKLCQIAGPLEDELQTNSEFLIQLINRKLMELQHLQELSSFPDRSTKIAHYIIHNINHSYRLKSFLYIVQNWCLGRNLIELMEDVCFDIEIAQSPIIEHKIQEDLKETTCDIY